MTRTEIFSKFTKKTLSLTFVLSTAAIVFSQDKQSFSGKIKDAQNNAVPYASVSFENKSVKENKVLYSDAVLSDDKGNFTVNVMPGTYEITVEAIDFKKLVFTKQIDKNQNIGDIKIEAEESITNAKTKEIQGVTLTATTKPYKVELDKKTYDVNQDLLSKGGNLQDVLSNVPSVAVDTDGTVSMRGSSNVKFLINGKPSALLGIDDGANALQSIPADQIDKIEVITNPSSKFEASGTAGILNIILKKTKKTGFNGSVTGTLGFLPQTSLNTNLSWKKGDLTWFLNGGGGYRETEGTNKYDTYYKNAIANLGYTETHQNAINNNNTNNYNASTGFVYDINKKTSVNASATVRTFSSNTDGTVDYNYLNQGTLYQSSQRLNTGKGDNSGLQGDFGLDHKFNENGQNLSLSLSLQKNKSNTDTEVIETENSIFKLQNIINQITENNSTIGKIDYELPIGEKSKLEAGYRLDVNKNNYDNKVRETNDQNIALTFLENYSNLTNYGETFNAFYTQFKSKIGKIGYQIGLRNENSKISIQYSNLAGLNKDNTKTYNNLFPSVFLSYDLGKENQLLINYSKRIDRPRSFFMIPFPSYNDSQNIFDGNIDLNPSFVDSYELGYSISKKKFTINPTLYYRSETDDTKMLVYSTKESYTENGIEKYKIVFHTKPINLGEDNRFGLDLNFNFDAFTWLKFIGSLDLYGYKVNGTTTYDSVDNTGNNVLKTANFSGNGISSRIRLTPTFKIDKTFSIQVQTYIRGGEKTEYQRRKGAYSVSLGASKTIWKGNGTLSFNVQDIFNTRVMKFTTFSDNSSRDTYMQFSPRQVSLSLTYRFKQGEKVDQPKKKKENNSNENGGDEMPPM